MHSFFCCTRSLLKQIKHDGSRSMLIAFDVETLQLQLKLMAAQFRIILHPHFNLGSSVGHVFSLANVAVSRALATAGRIGSAYRLVR